MANLRECAFIAIDQYIKSEHPDHYPAWSGAVPQDTTNGWGATDKRWKREAKIIITSFETCIGRKIQFTTVDLGKLNYQTLGLFEDYLVEQAEVAIARSDIAIAQSRLAAARSSISNLRAAL